MSPRAKKKVRVRNSDVEESHGMEYDPDQDHEEVRGVLAEYRVVERERNEGNTSQNKEPSALQKRLENADHIFGKVKATTEAIADSRIVKSVSEDATSLVRAMKSGSGAFDVDEFLQKLVTFMGGRNTQQLGGDGDDSEPEDAYDSDASPLDWELIGHRALAHSHRVPVLDFMLGPLSVEVKQRAAPKRSKLEKNKVDERKPQAITEDDITRSENETTKNVFSVNQILEANSPINMFRFIINPKDFGQSVENLFYLSFLIRDGVCALQTTDEGEPEIFTCERPSADEYSNGLQKRQLVMELDMATWRRAIEVFDIREPLIPQRKKAETRIGNKWYG